MRKNQIYAHCDVTKYFSWQNKRNNKNHTFERRCSIAALVAVLQDKCGVSLTNIAMTIRSASLKSRGKRRCSYMHCSLDFMHLPSRKNLQGRHVSLAAGKSNFLPSVATNCWSCLDELFTGLCGVLERVALLDGVVWDWRGMVGVLRWAWGKKSKKVDGGKWN